MPGDSRLEDPWPGCADPPGGKVPGFRGIVVHFPGGNAGGQTPGDAVGPVGLTRQEGKCPDSGGKWFTFPEGMLEEGCLEGMALFEVFYTVDVAWVVCRSH